MKLEDMTLEDVTKRLAELEEEVRETQDVELVNKAIEEKKALLERKAELEDLEKRQAEAEALNNDEVEPDKVVENSNEKRGKEMDKKEFRTLWLKNLMGILTEEERAAYSTVANADAIIPEEMQADIITKAKEYAPILEEVTLLNVNGAVKFAVEGDNNAADVHTELATINAKSDSMVEVVLSAYELTKLIQISAAVKSMSVASFESWLIAQLAEAIAMKAESLIFNGTGSGQAQGILTVKSTPDYTSITAANVLGLIGSLKSGYARNGKIAVNRKTFFTKLLSLELSVNNEVVKVATGEATGEYRILGADVLFTDSVADDVVIYGDFRKYVANFAAPQNVVSQFDIDTNSYKYLGAAVFDGKVALAEAFKTIQPATTA